MDMWRHEERSNQKQTCERIRKHSRSDKEVQRERVKLYGDSKRKGEGHVLRRMVDA